MRHELDGGIRLAHVPFKGKREISELGRCILVLFGKRLILR
jgi:hypothetical protein